MWTHACNGHLIFVYPHQVLTELKKSNFTLLNQSIHFDENGDPEFGSYSIVFWNQTGDAEEVGFYHFNPWISFFINGTKIQWYTKGEVFCFSPIIIYGIFWLRNVFLCVVQMCTKLNLVTDVSGLQHNIRLFMVSFGGMIKQCLWGWFNCTKPVYKFNMQFPLFCSTRRYSSQFSLLHLHFVCC